MRAALPALLLFVGIAAAGQTLGTLTMDSPLRASPKADGLETGTLARGSTVVVHHEEGDWLAVQPPRGSVSWISHLFLEFPDGTPNAGFPKNAVVRADGDVKLAVGRAGVPRPLDVRRTAIPDGTIVLVIGPAVKVEDDRCTWYPVVPPEDDFRYLPRSAVQLQREAPVGFVVKSPAADSASTRVPVPAEVAGPVPVGGKPGWPNHPLWVQAEQAERAGDLEQAERLYFQLAKEMNAPGGDGELANLCYTRVHAIRERRRARQGGSSGSNWSSAAQPDSAVVPAAAIEHKDATPREPAAERSEKPAEGRGQWTGSGFLRIAGFKIGARQAYALEDSRGRLMYYAVPGPGVELDRHRNKTIDLFGTLTSPPELRGVALMEVQKVDSVR